MQETFAKAFFVREKLKSQDNFKDFHGNRRYATDPMHASNLAHDVANLFFYENYGSENYSVRSLEEMARLFDERFATLKNVEGIFEQLREIQMEALKSGFVKAVEMRMYGTSGAVEMDNRFFTRQSIAQFALGSVMDILRTGASEETQSLMFQGLSKIVDLQSRILTSKEHFEAVERHLKTRLANSEEQRKSWESISNFQEMVKIQQQKFDKLIVTLMGDMNNIRSNAYSEINVGLFTQTQNFMKNVIW